jgi:2-keto-4-pentenoate hydratase/2-oxohepta-3-ene-1,7-dioic acid hydratase in catechol pathway
MKLVSFFAGGEARLGVVSDERIYDAAAICRLWQREQAGRVPEATVPSDALAFVHMGPRGLDILRQAAAYVSALGLTGADAVGIIFQGEHVRLAAPVPRPGKIICLAGNYAEHVREGGQQAYGREETTPWLFIKPATTVIGPGEAIRLPRTLGIDVDWECELGVVMGEVCAGVPAASALDYVLGYTVFNDISARAIDVPIARQTRDRDQFHDWLHGKWFDTFGPMGPCIVTEDEIPDPQALHLELRYNGEVRQSATTGQMIYPVADLIEWISAILTLEPGDIISTGTPSGIGRTTGTSLQDGDVLEAEIERIGVLRNPVQGAGS